MNVCIRIATTEDLELADELTTLINSNYTIDEAGLWVDDYNRTSKAEISDKIKMGNVAIAWVQNVITGVVVFKTTPPTGYFGMLVCQPDYRGKGVGGRLVNFAEEQAKQNGCTKMRLDVLKPGGWKHEMKEFLCSWYERLGYEPKKDVSLENIHPEATAQLATECKVCVYYKVL